MRALKIFVVLVFLATPVSAGTFNRSSSSAGSSARNPGRSAALPVEVIDFSDRIVRVEYGYQTRAWTVEVRAVGRTTCFVEFKWLDAEGYQLDYDNAHVSVPKGSNGFTIARGSNWIPIDLAHEIRRIEASANCR